MAYISKETAKKIRDTIKSELPEYKFSVVMDGYTSLNVAIMAGPIDLGQGKDYTQVNHYWIDDHYKNQPEILEVLKKVNEIIMREGEYYNNSDMQTDYCDVAFFYNISIGKWNKPYQVR